MKNRAIPLRIALALTLCALVLSLAAAGCGESPAALSQDSIRLAEQCEAVFSGDSLTVTDTDDNNDVWSSKLLLDTGMTLTPGEQYSIRFSLAGEAGVGEFFLCKSENIDDRYDDTFAAEAGERIIAFTAAGDRLYIGMQVGSLGSGHSVTAAIPNLSLLSESANPALLRAENCTVAMAEGTVTATDTGDNNDVWNSKLLYDTGIALEKGKTYQLDFTLAGEQGVGEFFVCKAPGINSRDDATFVNTAGPGSVVFTAACDRLYVGMQMGNLGAGNSVTLTLGDLKEEKKTQSASRGENESPAIPAVLISENCTYTVNTEGSKTVVTAVDTSAEKDVWTSKLLLYLGELLEKDRFYAANFNLAGDNGVGEFFFCKKDNLNDRYSFDDVAGDHTAKFKAEDSKLYAGMQFGNIGEGNQVTATIQDVFTVPGMQTGSENCTETLAQDRITLTDTDDNPDVWNSKAVYDAGVVLEPGREYTATVTLTGDNGVGEFFFLKNNDIGQRYSFDDTPGNHTITFTAEDTALYFGIQCGNIGNGNSVTISDITVTPVAAAPETPVEDSPQDPEIAHEAEEPAETPAEEAEAPAEEAEAPAEETEAPAEGE